MAMLPFWHREWLSAWSILKVFRLVCVLSCVTPLRGQNVLSPDPKNCGSDIVVRSAEVLEGFEPTFPSVPSACHGSVRQAIGKFRDEDQKNWVAYSNRACSAKLGWVENSPGICNAGGPPPICPRTDHWHKDPQRAELEWARFQAGIREQRQQTITDAACGCWMNMVKNVGTNTAAQMPFNPYSAQPIGFNGYSGQAVIPCSRSAECEIAEPGSVCTSRNLCELPGGVDRGVRAAGDLVASKALDKGREKAVALEAQALLELAPKKVATLLTEIGEDFDVPVKVGAAFLAPANDRFLIESYRSTLQQIHDQLASLRELAASARQVDAGKGPYQPYTRTDLSAKITQIKSQIRSNMDMANNVVEGIVQERQLPKGACYNVLQYQNSAINADVAQIYSMPN